MEENEKAAGLQLLVEGNGTSLLNAAYALAAAMVTADNEIKEVEVEHAKALGMELLPEFDDAEFMRWLNLSNGLHQFKDAVLALSISLSVDGKDAIYNYLREIAIADDVLAEEEEELLSYVRQQWGLEHLL